MGKGIEVGDRTAQIRVMPDGALTLRRFVGSDGSSFDSSILRRSGRSDDGTDFFTINNVQPSHAGTYRLYVADQVVPTFSSTSPNRTFTLTVLPDADRDGMPDEWESASGLDPNDPSDARLDKDGDGQTNLAEYQAGTVPTDPGDALKVQKAEPVRDGVQVAFPAAANLTYTVEACAGLNGGPWEKVADVVARSTPRTETVIDGRSSGSPRFYRVVTPRRP